MLMKNAVGLLDLLNKLNKGSKQNHRQLCKLLMRVKRIAHINTYLCTTNYTQYNSLYQANSAKVNVEND